MYTIYIKDKDPDVTDWTLLHSPLRDVDNLIVINPVLNEAVNTHGSLEFSIAPNNPHYDELQERATLVKVSSDTKGRKIWFGRIVSIDRAWNRTLSIYCEGELALLCDATYQPFGHTGTPKVLFQKLLYHYSQSDIAQNGYNLRPGNITVTDPNNNIVRSSADPMALWEIMDSKLFGTSLGGYVVPRYDESDGTHYVDYLADFDETSTQVVKFGKNLLDFREHSTAQDVITVLYPYGAERDSSDPLYAPDPPANGLWRYRIDIGTVNPARKYYIENQDGIDLWGRVYGYRVWEDITLEQNLYDKAVAWLATQIAKSMTLEVSAVDLAFVDADVEQIQVGQYVLVQSEPHGLNARLLCTSKTTYLTELEKSAIVLGAGMKTITDLQTAKKEEN